MNSIRNRNLAPIEILVCTNWMSPFAADYAFLDRNAALSPEGTDPVIQLYRIKRQTALLYENQDVRLASLSVNAERDRNCARWRKSAG